MPRLRSTNMMVQLPVALVVLGAAACATHRSDDTLELEEAPQRLWSPPLAYPDSLMMAHVEGVVVLEARVDADGRVDRSTIRVIRSTHPGFEEPAIEMLFGTRFRPGYLGDLPRPALVEIPVRFELGSTVGDSMAALEAVVEGERLARAGSIGPAMVAFTEARRLDTRISQSPEIWLTLCWYGSTWGQVEDVIGACDRLVSLDPDGVSARDARGIARALTGNLEGAIADFEAVIAASRSERQRAERAAWVQALGAGRNPLTPDVLEDLKSRGP